MNRTVMIVMAAAFAIAIVIALVIASAKSKKPEPKVAGLEVLVANKILIKGDNLKAEDVHWQAWAEDATFEGLIKKSEQPNPDKLAAYGAPLRRDIESGEPITTAALVLDAKGSFLSAMLDPGMRAVSVAVRGEAGGAGGFISPGDQVDVILAYTVRITNQAAAKTAPKYAIQVVLRDIKVLAVDQNAKDDVHDPKIAKSVTLEVDEEGAEKLALAQQMGELSLALRRLGEKDAADAPQPPQVNDANTIDVIKEADQSDSSEVGDVVRVYSGNTIENVPVRPAPAPPQPESPQ